MERTRGHGERVGKDLKCSTILIYAAFNIETAIISMMLLCVVDAIDIDALF